MNDLSKCCQKWGVLLCCAVAMDKVVLVGQQQAGTGSGSENGMHRRVHTMVLFFPRYPAGSPSDWAYPLTATGWCSRGLAVLWSEIIYWHSYSGERSWFWPASFSHLCRYVSGLKSGLWKYTLGWVWAGAKCEPPLSARLCLPRIYWTVTIVVWMILLC